MRRLSTFLLFPLAAVLVAAAPSKQPHLDRDKVPYGCGTCHAGFIFQSGGGSAGCLNCHTSSPATTRFVKPGTTVVDIATEMRKPYRHPTGERGSAHRKGETLPEVDRRAVRHAECADCHDPHLLSADDKYAGKRIRKAGNFSAEVKKEYELCYLCHGDSANLPPKATNKRVEFAVSNPSYHPVEGEGKTEQPPSLLRPYRGKKVQPGDVSTISCSDCHGSDNPGSPKGPHGSVNPYILVANYSTRDNIAESAFAYELCYRCHSRTSILGDESFRFHSLHIRGKEGAFADGTSCYTCHNSHGSTEHRSMIRFNTEVVTANKDGVLKIEQAPSGYYSGKCFLSCHGADHSGAAYPPQAASSATGVSRQKSR